MIGVVVELAATRNVPVRLQVQPIVAKLRKFLPQRFLCRAQREHRNPRAHVVCVVLHDVVHQAVEVERQAHAGGGGQVGAAALPFLPVLEPGDLRIRVVNVHDETHDGVPHQERQQDRQLFQHEHGLAGRARRERDAADPGPGAGRVEQAVELVELLRAARDAISRGNFRERSDVGLSPSRLR